MMKKIPAVTILVCAVFAAGAFAQIMMAPATGTGSRVTVVEAKSAADGKSSITEKVLEECIIALPSLNQLEADVTARNEYLKEINGVAGKNDHVRTFTASVIVSYQLRQKLLIIITQNSLDGQEPITREEERIIMRQSQPFVSDLDGGDIFAGRSNRRYYYSSAEKAAESAKSRAGVWVRQQQNVLCSVGR